VWFYEVQLDVVTVLKDCEKHFNLVLFFPRYYFSLSFVVVVVVFFWFLVLNLAD